MFTAIRIKNIEMNYSQMLALSGASEVLIIAGVALVLCVGYLILNFWREILLGTFSVFIIVQLLKEQKISEEPSNAIKQEFLQETTISKIQSKMIEEEIIINRNMIGNGGIDFNSYMDECVSLTQKKELCQEITTQLE